MTIASTPQSAASWLYPISLKVFLPFPSCSFPEASALAVFLTIYKLAGRTDPRHAFALRSRSQFPGSAAMSSLAVLSVWAYAGEN